MLPMELIWHIQDYMRWRHKTIMVSREWLGKSLRNKKVRIRTWRGQLRVFSYLRVFGPYFVGMSWHRFCKMVYINRRRRNLHYRLTWKSAAINYMKKRRCQGCGRLSRANIAGVRLCVKCRFNRNLKYSYMVMTYQARRMGVPKRILNDIPYYRMGQARLRFWHEIILHG